MKKPLLIMENIFKQYSTGIVANHFVNFSINEGEIHALAGENGAGKSTLMRILYGLVPFQSGTISLNGDEIRIPSPLKAMEYGIGMVHQHFMLIEELSVTDNIILGMEPNKAGFINYQQAHQLVKELSAKYNMSIDPDDIVEDLTVAQKQKVEILKVLARKAKIIILDEPTAVLTAQEVAEFFNQLVMLKNAGHTIIIITHKINEMKQICDRISILKLGKSMGTYDVNSLSEYEISKLMVGGDFKVISFEHPTPTTTSILDIKNLTYVNDHNKRKLNDVSFSVYSQEILGIVGVEGNGQTELIDIITGNAHNYQGEITINNQSITKASIKAIRKLGMGYIPEDRIKDGVNLEGSVLENLTAVAYRRPNFGKVGFINSKATKDYSKRLIESYGVKTSSYLDKIVQLSGGNMQKVVCAREIEESKTILIANQPTRGVDIGAMISIHEEIMQLRDNGKAIVLVSSDMNEIYRLCRRIIIFYEGEIVAEIPEVSKLTEEELGLYMLGLKRQEVKDENKVN